MYEERTNEASPVARRIMRRMKTQALMHLSNHFPSEARASAGVSAITTA